MAATFDDAKAGWEILRQAGFTLTRDELNARLEQSGYFPISARTFAHYEKLRRYGYERYVPINQLDVKSLKDPLWDKAVRGRYPVYREPLAVVIELQRPGHAVEISGATAELSPAYVNVQVEQPELVERLAKQGFQRRLKSERVTVYFPQTEDKFPAIVERVTVEKGADCAQLAVRFLTLAPVEGLTGRSLLPTGELHVRIEPSDDTPLLSEVVRKLYWLFQVLDTGKVICEEFLSELGFGQKYALPPVRLESLGMGAGIHATVVTGLPALFLVTSLADRLGHLRFQYTSGIRPGGQAAYVKARNELFAEVAFEIKRRMTTQIAELQTQVKLPLDAPYGRSSELAESQLLPALDELLDGASGKVILSVTD